MSFRSRVATNIQVFHAAEDSTSDDIRILKLDPMDDFACEVLCLQDTAAQQIKFLGKDVLSGMSGTS